MTGELPDQQTLEHNGEVLDDDTGLLEYDIEKEIILQRVAQNTGEGEHMNLLELDHFSRLFERLFETFRQGRVPNSEVAPFLSSVDYS